MNDYYLFILKKDPILLNSGNDKKEVLKNDNLSSKKNYILLELTKMTKKNIELDKKHPFKTIWGEIKIHIIPYNYNKTKNKLKVINKATAIIWTDEKKINIDLLKQVCLLYGRNKLKTDLFAINTI